MPRVRGCLEQKGETTPLSARLDRNFMSEDIDFAFTIPFRSVPDALLISHSRGGVSPYSSMGVSGTVVPCTAPCRNVTPNFGHQRYSKTKSVMLRRLSP